MKILYAVQATGNGHISRAVQLLPYLQRYGKVDVFLSGANAQLSADLPVRFRSKGLSLFYNSGGGLHYKRIAAQLQPHRIWKEVKSLPVEKYDLVLNDFESITALACRYKKVPSVNLGHQAAFQSALVPRPMNADILGEWLLKNYARASQYVGLHFRKYDSFIFDAVIKQEIREAKPRNNGHITVYLSAYKDTSLLPFFHELSAFQFHVFSKEVRRVEQHKNVKLIPVSQDAFNESMINCYGVITGAGFETPAEAMHLGKKLMVIPIRGQYEQYCNAAALREFNVPVFAELGPDFKQEFFNWIGAGNQQAVQYVNEIPLMLNYLIDNYPSRGVSLDLLYPDLLIA